MKTHYDQKFYQGLLDSILDRRRMDMSVWIGNFKEVLVRRFYGVPHDVRERGAKCNTVACISGHAAFIDPVVSGTTEEGPIIGNKLLGWCDYSDRVFGDASLQLVERCCWDEFLNESAAFKRLPQYKQAVVALCIYARKRFGYKLNAPDRLGVIVNEVAL